MKLVVDTNDLLKALIKNSRVRAILLSPVHQFVVAEYVIEEVEKHLPLIMEKSSLGKRGQIGVEHTANQHTSHSEGGCLDPMERS